MAEKVEQLENMKQFGQFHIYYSSINDYIPNEKVEYAIMVACDGCGMGSVFQIVSPTKSVIRELYDAVNCRRDLQRLYTIALMGIPYSENTHERETRYWVASANRDTFEKLLKGDE